MRRQRERGNDLAFWIAVAIVAGLAAVTNFVNDEETRQAAFAAAIVFGILGAWIFTVSEELP